MKLHPMDRYVWRGNSVTATTITNLCDRVNEEQRPRLARVMGWLVKTLGTGNYFG